MVSFVTVIKNGRCVYMNVRYSYYLKRKKGMFVITVSEYDFDVRVFFKPVRF